MRVDRQAAKIALLMLDNTPRPLQFHKFRFIFNHLHFFATVLRQLVKELEREGRKEGGGRKGGRVEEGGSEGGMEGRKEEGKVCP